MTSVVGSPITSPHPASPASHRLDRDRLPAPPPLPRYTPTASFETFPFPWPPGTEPVDAPRVIAIAAAAKEPDERCRAWLDPPDTSETKLKKRILTNLYNERPTWLRNLRARLDRAVWNSYGWPADELPEEVEEEVILPRLLELNGKRSQPALMPPGLFHLVIGIENQVRKIFSFHVAYGSSLRDVLVNPVADEQASGHAVPAH